MDGTPFGRYRLIELIGRGGMGEVWRAYDTETQRVVAVKVLPVNLANDPTFIERFRREALAAAGLNDPMWYRFTISVKSTAVFMWTCDSSTAGICRRSSPTGCWTRNVR